MKKQDIKQGGLYTARISGNIVTVRVDAIRTGERGYGKRQAFTAYDVTNLKTGRKTTFHSAMKFRGVAPVELKPGQGVEDFRTAYKAVFGLDTITSLDTRAKEVFAAWNEAGRPVPARDFIDAECRKPGRQGWIDRPQKVGKLEGTDPFVLAAAEPATPMDGVGHVSQSPTLITKPSKPTSDSATVNNGEGEHLPPFPGNTSPASPASSPTATTPGTDTAGAPPATGRGTANAPSHVEAELASPGHVAALAGSIVNERLFAKYGCAGFWAEHPEWHTMNPATLLDILRQKPRLGKVALELSRRMRVMERAENPEGGAVQEVTAESENSSADGFTSSEPGVSIEVAKATTPNQPETAMTATLSRALSNVATPKKRTPTAEQQAILDLGVEMQNAGPGGVMVIEAGAGTGKTTTDTMLEQILKGNGQYTAFNASLVADSKTKFKVAACNTTHSLAFRAVGKRYAARLNGGRVRSDEVARQLGVSEMVFEMTDKEGKPIKKTLAASFLAGQVMQAIKRFCQSADPVVAAEHFRYLDGLDQPNAEGQRTYERNNAVREYLLPFAEKAWADLSDPKGTLPFNHDVYVKVWQLNKPVIAADYILIDEAQDLAPVFLSILQQQRRALVILVGDSNQSIYEWRGAVDALKAYPEAPRRSLSQSFRFGQAIADVANSILECLTEKTTLRLKGLPTINSVVAPVANPVAILTRTNAVAVANLLNAIGEGKRPFLVGGGTDVIAFVAGAQDLQQGRTTSHPELACFSTWSEVEEYSKLDEGEDLRLMVKLINEFSAEAILSALRSMPREQDADLVICTAHKSKGREWDTVRLAQDFPTRSKCQDSDLKLLYVAATRAKLQLDVSQCPFFTGEDALEIKRTVAVDAITDAPAVLPATPSKPAVTGFTWSKYDGQWVVRGPKGATGEVEVVRANGSKSRQQIKSVVREFVEATLYAVK